MSTKVNATARHTQGISDMTARRLRRQPDCVDSLIGFRRTFTLATAVVDEATKETINMSDPVSSVTQAQVATQATDVRAKAPAPRPQSVPSETVQLSSAAQAALQEAVETQAQTAKEAGNGDLQAKRLLAKETAAKQEYTSTTHVVA